MRNEYEANKDYGIVATATSTNYLAAALKIVVASTVLIC